jgi:hypothetical protein
VQQGDPLGPLLFAAGLSAVTKAVAAIQGTHSVWYLDDGMVFALSFTALNEALVTICKAAEQIGLEVNLSKCALVVPASVDYIFAGQPPAPLSEIP